MKMKNNKTLQWRLLVLHVFASFFFLLPSSVQALTDTAHSGSIKIDCGAREDYVDRNTKTSYKADDERFVEFGKANNVLLNYSKEQIGNQLKTLTSFPKGKRNCYTLPISPKHESKKNYIVRAFFAYGNYDNNRTVPSFDLYVGVNYWATFNPAVGHIARFEVIHDDDINVCLVNTGHGTPFISLLEVFPWQNSRYDEMAPSFLRLMSRSNLGMSEDDATYISYPDDIYERSWFNRRMENTVRINTSTDDIDSNTSENTYKLPKQVLSSAVVSSSLVINMDPYSDNKYDYYVYLHFYDFVSKSSQNQQKRNMIISFSDGVNVSFTLDYMKPTTLVRSIKIGDHVGNITIRSTSDSQLPAILNAYEIFRVLTRNYTTDEGEVAAIREIKRQYGIKRISWQGDPCGPMNYTWEGLTCDYNGTPRITSINLSSSNLSGGIAPSFSNFTELKALDLSHNNLTGKVPESLAVPKKLNDINLTGNKLEGPIPEPLVKKKKAGNFSLSTGENENLEKPKQGISKPKKSNKGKKIGIIAGATGGAATLSGATLAFTLKFRFGINLFGKKDKRNKGSNVGVTVKPKINTGQGGPQEAIEQISGL